MIVICFFIFLNLSNNWIIAKFFIYFLFNVNNHIICKIFIFHFTNVHILIQKSLQAFISSLLLELSSFISATIVYDEAWRQHTTVHGGGDSGRRGESRIINEKVISKVILLCVTNTSLKSDYKSLFEFFLQFLGTPILIYSTLFVLSFFAFFVQFRGLQLWYTIHYLCCVRYTSCACSLGQ